MLFGFIYVPILFLSYKLITVYNIQLKMFVLFCFLFKDKIICTKYVLYLIIIVYINLT
jgi:hypothetical protein